MIDRLALPDRNLEHPIKRSLIEGALMIKRLDPAHSGLIERMLEHADYIQSITDFDNSWLLK